MPKIDQVERQLLSGLDARGHEVPDSKPMALPAGLSRPETLQEQIRRLVRDERIQAELASKGFETWEEYNDFDVGDDFDPSTPFEVHFDRVLATDITAAEIRDEKLKPTIMEATERVLNRAREWAAKRRQKAPETPAAPAATPVPPPPPAVTPQLDFWGIAG